MASWMTRTLLGMTLALGATALQAQESSNVEATMTDCSVFVEESPKECWGVSSPKQTVNTRDGQPVSVRRGDVLLFVTFAFRQFSIQHIRLALFEYYSSVFKGGNPDFRTMGHPLG